MPQEMILLWGRFQEFSGRKASERPQEMPVLAPWSHGGGLLGVGAGGEEQPRPPFWVWGVLGS